MWTRYENCKLDAVAISELVKWLTKHPHVTISAQVNSMSTNPGTELRFIFQNTDENGNFVEGQIDPLYFRLESKE